MKQTRYLLLFLALMLLLTGCSGREPKKAVRELYAMDTVMSLTAYGENAEKAVSDGAELILSVEQMLSVTDADSEVARLNEAQGGAVSAELERLYTTCAGLSRQTDGAFRIDLYALTSLWGFTTGAYRVPEETEISAVLENLSRTDTVLSGDGSLQLNGVSLDFGAAAKGCVSQLVCDSWRESGITSGIVSLGGNVQTLGLKPDGTQWRVGIRNPFEPDGISGVVAVSDTAVVTSGGYQRYFEQDGVRYCHIMDPRTGCPVSGDLASVTVVAPDGLLCDAFSTALYVKGYEQAVEFWRSRTDFEAVLILTDGSVRVTEGLKDCFEGESFEVISR